MSIRLKKSRPKSRPKSHPKSHSKSHSKSRPKTSIDPERNYPLCDSGFKYHVRKVAAQQYLPYIGNRIEADSDLIDKILEFHRGQLGMIIGYIISNSSVRIDEELYSRMRKNMLENSRQINFENTIDDRPNVVLEMIQSALTYGKECKRSIPDTYLLIYISDHNLWQDPEKPYMDYINKIPVFCFAKPNTDINPLFPETSFGSFSFKEKYDKESSKNWDQSVEIIDTEVAQKRAIHEHKQPVVYFKGAFTGKFLYNIRENIFNLHRKFNNSLLKLEKLIPGKYTPVYEWYKYKYLLNLPGHYPWSNRLKYIMLLDSIILNVNVMSVNWKSLEKREFNFKDPAYITFLELFVDNSYYINYDFISESVTDKSGRTTAIDEHKKIKDLYIFIIKTVQRCEKNPAFFNKWRKKNKEAKMILHKLNNESINEYICECIIQNSRIISNRK